MERGKRKEKDMQWWATMEEKDMQWWATMEKDNGSGGGQ